MKKQETRDPAPHHPDASTLVGALVLCLLLSSSLSLSTHTPHTPIHPHSLPPHPLYPFSFCLPCSLFLLLHPPRPSSRTLIRPDDPSAVVNESSDSICTRYIVFSRGARGALPSSSAIALSSLPTSSFRAYNEGGGDERKKRVCKEKTHPVRFFKGMRK